MLVGEAGKLHSVNDTVYTTVQKFGAGKIFNVFLKEKSLVLPMAAFI